MAEITASLVKELREKTGAGMMDCKKALGEVQGDLEKAVDWLRTKGLSAAAKKAGRVAAEGLVGVAASGNRGAVVEVNAETDFVGRNEIFQKFVAATARIALDTAGDMTKIAAAPFPPSGRDVQGELTNMIATIGENMSLRRAASLSVSDGVVAAYMHNAVAPDLGKIGVLVALESPGNTEELAALGRQVAMHVAAANPIAVQIDVPPPTIQSVTNASGVAYDASHPAFSQDVVNIYVSSLDQSVLGNPSRLQVTINGQSTPVQSMTPAANGQTQITFVLAQSFGGASANLAVVVDGSSSAPVPITIR